MHELNINQPASESAYIHRASTSVSKMPLSVTPEGFLHLGRITLEPCDVAIRPSTRHQQAVRNLRMVTPRAESSPSNCVTPGEASLSPGTITAHSRFSRNSFNLICHWTERRGFRLTDLDDGPVPHQRQCGGFVWCRPGQNEMVVSVDQDADHEFSSLQARIRNGVTNCEMVDDLS